MGYKVNGTTIQITRGDSGYFAFTPYAMDENGEWSVYQPQEGDEIIFNMKKKMADSYRILLKKKVDLETFQMKLEPNETKGLDFGEYEYEVQLTTAAGDVDTYIPAVGETALIIITKEADK